MHVVKAQIIDTQLMVHCMQRDSSGILGTYLPTLPAGNMIKDSTVKLLVDEIL